LGRPSTSRHDTTNPSSFPSCQDVVPLRDTPSDITIISIGVTISNARALPGSWVRAPASHLDVPILQPFAQILIGISLQQDSSHPSALATLPAQSGSRLGSLLCQKLAQGAAKQHPGALADQIALLGKGARRGKLQMLQDGVRLVVCSQVSTSPATHRHRSRRDIPSRSEISRMVWGKPGIILPVKRERRG